MAIGDRIRRRRERKRFEDAEYNEIMSNIYGDDWKLNKRLDTKQMRRQYEANKSTFVNEASKRGEQKSKPERYNMAVSDFKKKRFEPQPTKRTTADTPVAPKIVAPIQKEEVKPELSEADKIAISQGFRNDQDMKRWLDQANKIIEGYEFSTGYKFGPIRNISNVKALQKKLGVTPDGKFGKKSSIALGRWIMDQDKDKDDNPDPEIIEENPVVKPEVRDSAVLGDNPGDGSDDESKRESSSSLYGDSTPVEQQTNYSSYLLPIGGAVVGGMLAVAAARDKKNRSLLHPDQNVRQNVKRFSDKIKEFNPKRYLDEKRAKRAKVLFERKYPRKYVLLHGWDGEVLRPWKRDWNSAPMSGKRGRIYVPGGSASEYLRQRPNPIGGGTSSTKPQYQVAPIGENGQGQIAPGRPKGTRTKGASRAPKFRVGKGGTADLALMFLPQIVDYLTGGNQEVHDFIFGKENPGQIQMKNGGSIMKSRFMQQGGKTEIPAYNYSNGPGAGPQMNQGAGYVTSNGPGMSPIVAADMDTTRGPGISPDISPIKYNQQGGQMDNQQAFMQFLVQVFQPQSEDQFKQIIQSIGEEGLMQLQQAFQQGADPMQVRSQLGLDGGSVPSARNGGRVCPEGMHLVFKKGGCLCQQKGGEAPKRFGNKKPLQKRNINVNDTIHIKGKPYDITDDGKTGYQRADTVLINGMPAVPRKQDGYLYFKKVEGYAPGKSGYHRGTSYSKLVKTDKNGGKINKKPLQKKNVNPNDTIHVNGKPYDLTKRGTTGYPKLTNDKYRKLSDEDKNRVDSKDHASGRSAEDIHSGCKGMKMCNGGKSKKSRFCGGGKAKFAKGGQMGGEYMTNPGNRSIMDKIVGRPSEMKCGGKARKRLVKKSK